MEAPSFSAVSRYRGARQNGPTGQRSGKYSDCHELRRSPLQCRNDQTRHAQSTRARRTGRSSVPGRSGSRGAAHDRIGTADRGGRGRVRTPARHHGSDEARHDERAGTATERARADQPVRLFAGVSAGVRPYGRADEPRHALCMGVARSVEGTDGVVAARHAWPLLHDADAGCVDERVRVAWYANDRQWPRTVRGHRTWLAGTLPDGAKQIRAPTNTVWIIGRTQRTDRQTTPRFARCRSNTHWAAECLRKLYTAPAGVVDPNVAINVAPVDQVARMDAATYFSTLARLVAEDPPPETDAPALAMLAKIGVRPGQRFDVGQLEPPAAKGLENRVQTALQKLQAAQRRPACRGTVGTSHR